VRSQRWGPRTLDLDLLLVDDLVLDEEDLELPHPEMTKRSFVLVPMVELEPLLVHPVTGETMLALLQRLGARPLVKHGSRLWN
jgi:7,8-dihydro-6-hydroxymethylpterin-pyrophosphokinase